MPKGANQKLKLYYLSRIMIEKTDDEHMITMPEIQKALEAYGVTADRKSLYDDLEALRVLGIDVIGEKVGRYFYYHVGSKQFEIGSRQAAAEGGGRGAVACAGGVRRCGLASGGFGGCGSY